jgi:hypothetical protein
MLLFEEFGSDPKWDASGNRRTYETRIVRPRFDFGFAPTHYASGRDAGELGGLFFRGDCRYGERLAAYGDRLGSMTLERPLRAAGKVALRRGVSDSTTLIGFYHSTESLTVNPSQQFGTPKHFLGAAVEGPSGEGFYFYPVYRNRDGGTSRGMGTNPPRIYPDGAPHDNTRRAKAFARQLHGRFRLPVHEVDERYTTVEAMSRGASDVDAAAAALILEQFLARDA